MSLYCRLKAWSGLQVDAVDLHHPGKATGPGATRIEFEFQFPALPVAARAPEFGGKTIRNFRCAAVLVMA